MFHLSPSIIAMKQDYIIGIVLNYYKSSMC